MSEWQPIETAPRDGTVLELGVKRGRTIESEGLGLWGVRSKNAPARKPLFCPLTGECFNGTQAERDNYADIPAWITQNKMYLVVQPSHWKLSQKHWI